MIELATRVFIDAGVQRGKAIKIVGVATFALGFPSAISIQILHNQDWVWAVALMLSGLFFAIAIITSGVRRFRDEQLNHADSDIRIGRWWDFVISVVVPLEAIVLTVWWIAQSWRWSGEGWLDPLGVDNVGTVLVQFAIVIGALLLLNRWIADRTQAAS